MKINKSQITLLVTSILVVILLAPLASSSPDGLEKVAEDHGFISLAQESLFDILPDYSIPGIGNETISTILAGIVGLIIVYGILKMLGKFLVTPQKSE